MPAHRKSLDQLKASGADKKNPQRFTNRTDPPVPKGSIKKAPRHLDAAHQKIWRELVANAPEGLLGSCDAVVLEQAVRLTYKMRFGPPDKWSSTNDGHLVNIMGKLGGTPGDRQRLNVSAPPEPTKEADPLDELD